MRITRVEILLASLVVCALAATSAQAQTAEANYKFERGFPVADTAKRAYDASDLRRAIEAYKFFYPTISTEAVMQQGQAAGAKLNEVGIVMATSPRQQFGAANADTPYAITTVDLKAAGPMVVELPPGPFIGFVDDHNMRWVQDMGTIGPEKGQGGKHLILPPDYEGEVPSGYYAFRSKTWKVVVFVRIMPVGGDVAKAIKAANDIKVYPLAKAGDPVTHRFIDVSAKTMLLPSLVWEDKIDYWRELHAVMQTETAPGEFRPMLGMLAQLGIEQGKPFNPDARAQRILEQAAHTALAEMSVTFYGSRNPERIAWKDRVWEWFPLQLISAKTGDFGVPAYVDLEASDAYAYAGYGVSAAIGRRAVGAGSVYWLAARDGSGAFLDGGKTYKLTVPGPVPGKLFWSMTVYDVNTRCLIATDQNRAAIRSLLDKPQPNADGSYDLYFGPKPPAGKESMWIKTIPGKGWWSAFRIYGPQEPAFDGTWKLNDIVELKY
jgi:hypothetical protein